MRLIFSRYDWGTRKLEADEQNPHQGMLLSLQADVAEITHDEKIGASVFMHGDTLVQFVKETTACMTDEQKQLVRDFLG